MQIDGNKVMDAIKAQRNDALDMVAILQAQNAALQAALSAAQSAPVKEGEGDG